MAAPLQFVIDPFTQTPVRTFEGHEEPIQAVAASSSSSRHRYMVTASADNTVVLWDLKEEVLLRQMKGHRDWVRAVAVSPKGRNWPCIASGDDNGKIFAWKEETKAQPIDAHPGSWICSLDFSPDGAVLATGSEDKSVKLWNTETWQPQGNPINCGVSVTCVRYSPSGKFIAVATTLGVQIYRSTGSGDCIQKVTHLSPVLAWTPNVNDERLLSGGHRPDCTIREWHPSTWKQVHDPWIGHTDDITAIAVNYNGALVASASEDKHVRLWGLSDRETIMIFQHSDRVRSVIFSFDRKHILSGGDDKKISKWAIPGKAVLQEPDRGPQIVNRGDGTVIPGLDTPEDAALTDPHGERASNISQQHTSPVDTFELVSPAESMKRKGKEESADGEYRPEAEKSSLHDIDKFNLYANRSKAMVEKKLWKKALIDAEKVTELNPSSYQGYQLEHAALHGAHRYDEAIEVFQDMLSKLDNAPDTRSRGLRQQFLNQPEAEDVIQRVIDTQLDNTPIRVLDTDTGLLCDRQARASTFKDGQTYKELLSSTMAHADRRKEHIEEVVRKEFQCVMLSHRWEGKEPLLHNIGTNVVYKLSPVGGIAKLLSFCRIACDAGYRWAWSDTCCIDKTNNVELQQSLNAMFVWYHHSALTIVYLSDVPPSSRPGALAKSKWNTRGWTVQEFLAPKFVIFFQKDWTLYLGDPSDIDNPYPNHKDSIEIMQELKDATKIDLQFLISFQPGMKGAREKLQWASARATTVLEDMAYSLFGIFGVQLPLIYGEGKQWALGRLLQEIVARSCDITALDWIGQSSGFNSCLPADISSYKAPPHIVPPLSEDQIQILLSSLRNATALKWASKLFTQLNNLSPPRFASCRLHLPCIVFRVTEIRPSGHNQHQGACCEYKVKADGLYDLLITTGENMDQFSPTPQKLYLVRPWDRDLLQLPSPDDEEYWDAAEVPEEYKDWEPNSGQALRLSVHLEQPFSAFLLERQHGNEYRRIASDRYITARIKDMANEYKTVTTLEIV